MGTWFRLAANAAFAFGLGIGPSQTADAQAPAGAPVFIAQGTADTTVRPEITKQFARHLCQQGTRVRFLLLPGVSHTFAARNSAGQALAWMSDRFRGAPAPSDCGR
ncbi:MAG: lipase family protein [Methyloceanibacter sp.]